MELEYARIRPPAVAGLFYPGDAAILRSDVTRLLNDSVLAITTSPKALLVPHAGYQYSGATAAAAYRTLASTPDRITRVVLLGPAHRVHVRGFALARATDFMTPLGRIPLAKPPLALQALPFVNFNDHAHAPEHALEVQLPFLQEVLGEFTVLPIVVGEASAEEVAAVLHEVWGGDETLILISSDLSHFLNYFEAQHRDKSTVARILDGASDISHDEACGATALNGFLLEAGHRGLTSTLLSLCNSGDTAGSRDRVVGYCAMAFANDETRRGKVLLEIARGRIAHELKQGREPAFNDPWLNAPGATFVTLTLAGQLRGCIGSLVARRALGTDVADNAAAAAFRDPRFAPLSVAEYGRIAVEVSELSPSEAITYSDEGDALSQLRPHIDGVILECGSQRATFLPQVWQQLPDPMAFLSQLKLKAGLRSDFWSSEIGLSRYTVHKYREL
ncbi:MAG: AmmeMemoRadiSam system protein B [Gammaproteobacteria bacterium]|nr:AmmeMemoRadiSam system protein B [Gammaproteobacteria bacterium]